MRLPGHVTVLRQSRSEEELRGARQRPLYSHSALENAQYFSPALGSEVRAIGVHAALITVGSAF